MSAWAPVGLRPLSRVQPARVSWSLELVSECRMWGLCRVSWLIRKLQGEPGSHWNAYLHSPSLGVYGSARCGGERGRSARSTTSPWSRSRLRQGNPGGVVPVLPAHSFLALWWTWGHQELVKAGGYAMSFRNRKLFLVGSSLGPQSLWVSVNGLPAPKQFCFKAPHLAIKTQDAVEKQRKKGFPL